jgi:hypothetical protein
MDARPWGDAGSVPTATILAGGLKTIFGVSD